MTTDSMTPELEKIITVLFEHPDGMEEQQVADSMVWQISELRYYVDKLLEMGRFVDIENRKPDLLPFAPSTKIYHITAQGRAYVMEDIRQRPK